MYFLTFAKYFSAKSILKAIRRILIVLAAASVCGGAALAQGPYFTPSSRLKDQGRSTFRVQPDNSGNATEITLNADSAYEKAFNKMVSCDNPVVLVKEKFSRSDFFLYYPLPDRAWHLNRAQPDLPVYAPEGCEDIYYSTGGRIFPMVCGDRLYFASNRTGTIGGYDLFVCRWDPEWKAWGEPENLGMPYSSPYNDYLFIDTDDGRYSIFASDRECPGTDSLYVYVLERNKNNRKIEITSAKALQQLCMLTPTQDLKKVNYSGAMSGVGANAAVENDYARKMAEVRSLRDSLAARIKELPDDSELLPLRERLAQADAELRKIEMDFLFAPVNSGEENLAADTDKELVGIGKAYTFTRKNIGGAVNFLTPPSY